MNEKLAYLAGFIDGEGSIMYTRNGFDYRRNRYYYRVILRVCNNEPQVIDWVLDNFPSKWFIEKRHHGGNTDDSYVISLHGANAVNLIEKVFPYLISKRPQARLARLAGYYHSLLHGGRKSKKYDPYLEPLRERLHKMMKGLNYRGKNSTEIRKQFGELLEPLPSNVEGNQQLSLVKDMKVARKVQRLMVEESTNNTNTSAEQETDDIVRSSQ
jgi:hypothetical protein